MSILSEIISFVLAVIFGVSGIIILGGCVYFGIYWYRHPHKTADRTEIIDAINSVESKVEQSINTIKKDLDEIKKQVNKNG